MGQIYTYSPIYMDTCIYNIGGDTLYIPMCLIVCVKTEIYIQRYRVLFIDVYPHNIYEETLKGGVIIMLYV